MKRYILKSLLLISSTYNHTNHLLTLIGIHYDKSSNKTLLTPINPRNEDAWQAYFTLESRFKKTLYQIHQINEKNKNTLSLIEKEHKKQLNHERWFQHFLYTSLFTFGIITYKTFINN